jgi:hypothetical protein
MRFSDTFSGLFMLLVCATALGAPLSMTTKVEEPQPAVAQHDPAGAKEPVRASADATVACPGFANTRVIDLSWSNPQRMYTHDVGGFGPRDALVVRFTTGPKSGDGLMPRISAAAYRSPPHWRFATLSSKPCDFEPQATPWASMAGKSITAVFALGENPSLPYYPILETNRTYYLNIRNSDDSSCTSSGVCDMYVDLVKAGPL